MRIDRRNVDQRSVRLGEKRLGVFQAPRADVLMGGLAGGGFEYAREVQWAQTRCGCQGCNVQIVLDVSFNKLQNTLQSATVKAHPR